MKHKLFFFSKLTQLHLTKMLLFSKINFHVCIQIDREQICTFNYSTIIGRLKKFFFFLPAVLIYSSYFRSECSAEQAQRCTGREDTTDF
jgi:hypothetical protein